MKKQENKILMTRKSKYSTISRRYRIYVNDVNKQVKNTPGFNFLYSVLNYIYTRHNMVA